jgi:hypothetical protein
MSNSPALKPYFAADSANDILLYSKNKWWYLNSSCGTGSVVMPTADKPVIPSLEILSFEPAPHLSVYHNKFRFHVMMVILCQMPDVYVLEQKEIRALSAIVLIRGLKINVYDSVMSYKGTSHDEFKSVCAHVYNAYLNESERLLNLFDNCVDPCEPDPQKFNLSMSYRTWYSAAREIQGEVPLIFNNLAEAEDCGRVIGANVIEFPPNSRIYYSHPKYFVRLSKRHDDNSEVYIPKLYKTSGVQSPSVPVVLKLPYAVHNNRSIKFCRAKHRRVLLLGEPYASLSYDGTIESVDIGAKVVAYKFGDTELVVGAFLNGPFTLGVLLGVTAQLLDKNGYVSMFFIESQDMWVKPLERTPKIRAMITLPWYYKQIIHDYNLLGRLKIGPLQSLDHIGIVDPNKTDIITYPVSPEIELYKGSCLETHRLMTFKRKHNVNERINMSK